MKLPNASKAVVEREKVADYLLNPAHRFGASKARSTRNRIHCETAVTGM